MDQSWRDALETLAKDQSEADATLTVRLSEIIPDDLIGDEIQICRPFKENRNSGHWLVWTERGPLEIVKIDWYWKISVDESFRDSNPDGQRKLRDWFYGERPLRERFKTRREAIAMLRSALSLSSD